MSEPSGDLLKQLEEHEAGVADLIAAYELVERQYFAAARASAFHLQQPVISNSAYWDSDANLG